MLSYCFHPRIYKVKTKILQDGCKFEILTVKQELFHFRNNIFNRGIHKNRAYNVKSVQAEGDFAFKLMSDLWAIGTISCNVQINI